MIGEIAEPFFEICSCAGRGSVLSSRLINFHQERLVGVAFLAVSYFPPNPNFNYEAAIISMNSMLGYDVMGYWEYFTASDAPKACEQNV